MSAWPSLLVLPLVAPDGIVVNDAQGNTGTIAGLYRQQLRVPLLTDHDNPNAVGEVLYVERDLDGSYWCLAGTSLRSIDWRGQASLAAESLRRGRDHRLLVLDHISLVEHGACAAGPVRLTTQKARPPGRPAGWSDRDWGRLQRGWQSHQRHGRDELLRIDNRPEADVIATQAAAQTRQHPTRSTAAAAVADAPPRDDLGPLRRLLHAHRDGRVRPSGDARPALTTPSRHPRPHRDDHPDPTRMLGDTPPIENDPRRSATIQEGGRRDGLGIPAT
jgi:hypothetical protein